VQQQQQQQTRIHSQRPAPSSFVMLKSCTGHNYGLAFFMFVCTVHDAACACVCLAVSSDDSSNSSITATSAIFILTGNATKEPMRF
jgi:hypothetical protein